ncbi:EAL domain-containing protein [Marinomonas transparens]|uniref:EAL domain-containing protein n=1 Tax=Marinomonas transparens TaxID=2795388 RepID=A0A934JNE1_9GAMM|nr:EAL domain-containing protein [Marinomonas transparens]MBJ7538996.1 EAL domain-containing protein [Marinomonas transparens]
MRHWAKLFLLTLLLSSQYVLSSDQSQNNTHTSLPTYQETRQTSALNVLQTAQFQPNLYQESQDFSKHAYWHKLEFPAITQTPPKQADKTIHLELNYHVIDYLDFYVFQNNKLINHWQRGMRQDWNMKAKAYYGIWIPIPLSNNHKTTLLIRKQGTSPLLTPIKSFNPEEAASEKEARRLFWTITISCLAILFAHNFFVFILLKQPGFIYYLALNIIIFASLSVLTGFNRWLFPEQISQWLVHNLFFIFGLGAWVLYRFTLYFLQEVRIPATSSFIRKYGDGVFLVFLLVTQIASVKTSAILFAGIEALLFTICIYWSIRAYSKGFIAVRFYLSAWLVLMIGALLNTMIYWQILPLNMLTESILPAASVLQLLIFSFAFADKAKHIEQARQLQTLTDAATGLPNRSYYFDTLIEYLPKQDPTELIFVMVKTTSHPQLSQAFGPEEADSAIAQVMLNINQRLMSMDGILSLPLPNKSTKKLIHINPETFAFFSITPTEINQQIQQLQNTLTTPTLVSKVQFRLQYQVGSALYPSQGANLDKLYQNALIASHSVTNYSQGWVTFNNELKNNHAHQLHLITLLTDDIQQGKLYFEIQPQVTLSSREVIGGEVLVRWRNEHLGQISPDEFIPLAEQTGLIYKLTDMVFDKIFQWTAEHPRILSAQSLSINISALDLLQSDFAERITTLSKRYNLKPENFTIEITETSALHNNEIVDNNVKHLHQAGFKLSIDDFGVGYNSMQNIIALETGELKIDRFFVINLLNNPQSQTLCQSIINLSKTLNITCVAEGIESEEVAQLLQSWHCQIGQGYHLHRPMSPDQYLALLS